MSHPDDIPTGHHHRVIFFLCLALSFAFLASVASGSVVGGEEEAFTGTPNIRVVGWRVDDAAGGNGDAGLHPGESAYLWISLSNGGSATARGVMATLSEVIDHPDVTILNKTGFWPDLPATGATRTSTGIQMRLLVAPTRPCAWRIPLRLEISAEGGYLVTRDFVLEMADPQVIDLALDRPRPAIHGVDASDSLGGTVASGDFDGDGYDDLILSAGGGDGLANTGTSVGEVVVVYGGTSPQPDIDLASPSTATTFIYGVDDFDDAGVTVVVSDMDGDGYDDLIIGAPQGQGIVNTKPWSGEIYVVYGLPTRPAVIEIASPPAGVEVSIIYGKLDERAGDHVALGDINGDGLADLVLGFTRTDGFNDLVIGAGEIMVIFGNSARLPGAFQLEFLSLSAFESFLVYGAEINDRLGGKIAVGDLDGDGYDDIVATYTPDGPNGFRDNSGGAVVIYGSDTLPDFIDLAVDPGAAGYIYGAGEDDRYSSVAVGDLNGDGYDDVILAGLNASGVDDTLTDAGEVAIIPGGPSRLVQLDLGSALTPVSFIYGGNSGSLLGWSLAAGDVDGDGYDDLLMGAPQNDGPGGIRAGAAILIYGQPQGISSLDTALLSGEAVMVQGESTDSRLAWDVALGDITGDGFMELILGAPFTSGPPGISRPFSGMVIIRPGGPRSSYRHDADTFAWIDASTAPDVGLTCDDCGVSIPIGFDFDFYGTTYDQVRVSSNGYLTFGDVDNRPRGVCAPATNLPDEVIAVFWDDLDLSAGGSVHALVEGTAPNRRLTVAWVDVPYFALGGAASFEVTLFETSDQILFQYKDVIFGGSPDNGATAVIGVEGRGGINGTPLSCPGTGAGVTALSAARWRRFASPTLYFGEDVETSGPGWTPSGLWNVTDGTTCIPASSSGTQAFYYGTTACDYDVGATTGSLTSPAIVDLPQDARLSFRHRRQTEGTGVGFDQSILQLQVDGGTFTNLVQFTENSNSWLHTDDFLSAMPEDGVFAPIDLSAHAGQKLALKFFFDSVDNVNNAFLGWMVDDVEIRGCPVFAPGGMAAVASQAVATAQPEVICETDNGRVDAIGSYCAGCGTGLSYQWSEDGLPIGGATSIVYDIPTGGMPGASGYSVGIECSTNTACATESTATTVTVVARPDAVADTLMVDRAGSDLAFQWTDVAGSGDYVLFSSTTANSAFTNEAATSASGSPGVTIPLPAEDVVFYLVAGRNSVCGSGPRNNFATP